MLQSETIQSKIHPTFSFDDNVGRSWYGIIPDRQMESIFPDHTQFVHLDTICAIIVKDSLRKYWSCKSETLFYLHENITYGYGGSIYERVEKTEWAREALLNRSCTKSCTNCPELNKGRKRAKIECRMHDY